MWSCVVDNHDHSAELGERAKTKSYVQTAPVAAEPTSLVYLESTPVV